MRVGWSRDGRELIVGHDDKCSSSFPFRGASACRGGRRRAAGGRRRRRGRGTVHVAWPRRGPRRSATSSAPPSPPMGACSRRCSVKAWCASLRPRRLVRSRRIETGDGPRRGRPQRRRRARSSPATSTGSRCGTSRPGASTGRWPCDGARRARDQPRRDAGRRRGRPGRRCIDAGDGRGGRGARRRVDHVAFSATTGRGWRSAARTAACGSPTRRPAWRSRGWP